MTPADFDFMAKLLKERSGLILGADKTYLLESRLMPLARRRGFKGLDELIGALRQGNEKLAFEVTDAMTTNESFFFRDGKPFEQFQKVVLPHLLKTRAAQKKFRIWCAASSSGQEPYSLAMILKENAAQLAGWTCEIVGTDISTEMLEKAKAGVYSQFEVQRGLPITHLVKYFKKTDENWTVDPAIRAAVTYKNWNLLEDLKPLGQFDVVFCRNVLIYFDTLTKTDVLERICRQMTEDGVLYLGGAETVLGISDRFKPIVGERGIYTPNTPKGFTLGATA